MKSCDLKWLADSLAVKRVNTAKKSSVGELQGLRLPAWAVFRKPCLICSTRAREQANLACDIREGP